MSIDMYIYEKPCMYGIKVDWTTTFDIIVKTGACGDARNARRSGAVRGSGAGAGPRCRQICLRRQVFALRGGGRGHPRAVRSGPWFRRFPFYMYIESTYFLLCVCTMTYKSYLGRSRLRFRRFPVSIVAEVLELGHAVDKSASVDKSSLSAGGGGGGGSGGTPGRYTLGRGSGCFRLTCGCKIRFELRFRRFPSYNWL